MLSFEEALSRLLASSPRLAAERVALDDASERVLAEAVRAPFDMPSFDYSAMDGYAIETTSFLGEGPWQLPVRGESRAGDPPGVLSPGSACRIFTGAPVPSGADAVVMQERVEREGERATFRARPDRLANIRCRGEDLAACAIALEPGTWLRPAHLALAASCDRAWLDVTRRPVVTLIGTGDELRAPGSTPVSGRIPESNGPALRAMAKRAGAHARVAPLVRDDRDSMTHAFEAALRGTDLLVTVGGVSVGDHDLVRPVLEDLGVQIDFWKVAIKPGKPLLVGRRGDAIVLGLPGNPTSAMVTFALFGVPLLRATQGDMRPAFAPMRAQLSHDVAHSPGRLDFIRATVAREKTGLIATPLSNQASGATTSMAGADALLCIEADRAKALAGEWADLLLLDEIGA
jgi:molybdopterin molybdotransferase